MNNNNRKETNSDIAKQAVGTFSGIMLALIVLFIVLPMGSCMLCMSVATLGAVVADAPSTTRKITDFISSSPFTAIFILVVFVIGPCCLAKHMQNNRRRKNNPQLK